MDCIFFPTAKKNDLHNNIVMHAIVPDIFLKSA